MDTDSHETITSPSGVDAHTTKPMGVSAGTRSAPGFYALPRAQPTTTDRTFLFLEAWLKARYASRRRTSPR